MSFHIKGFATIRLSVIDVHKSRGWHSSFWGLTPIEDLKDFVSFKIGDVCLDLALADAKSPASIEGAVGYWLVDDLDQAIARALELKGSIYRGPLKVTETQRTIVQIKDPFGNVFGLEADPKVHLPLQI